MELVLLILENSESTFYERTEIQKEKIKSSPYQLNHGLTPTFVKSVIFYKKNFGLCK
jgi:hypothetical protein